MEFRCVLDHEDALMFGNCVRKYPQESGLSSSCPPTNEQCLPATNLVRQEVCNWLRQCSASNQIINRVMAARKFPYRNCRCGTHDRRNPCRQTASIWKLRLQSWIVLVKPFAQLIGNHF